VAKKNTAIIISSQHLDKSCIGESQAFNSKIISHYSATKDDADVV
jgi:hypothetical protein